MRKQLLAIIIAGSLSTGADALDVWIQPQNNNLLDNFLQAQSIRGAQLSNQMLEMELQRERDYYDMELRQRQEMENQQRRLDIAARNTPVIEAKWREIALRNEEGMAAHDKLVAAAATAKAASEKANSSSATARDAALDLHAFAKRKLALSAASDAAAALYSSVVQFLQIEGAEILYPAGYADAIKFEKETRHLFKPKL